MKKMKIVGLFFLTAITLYFCGALLSNMIINGATYRVSEIFLMIALVVAWGQFFLWGTRKE